MKKHLLLAALCCTATASLQAAPAKTGGPITMQKLLAEMTDLKSMAEFPAPAFTTRQFSSYDRAATTPGGKNWFANGDSNQYLRVEDRAGRKEWVMMDAKGPGAVVRMWSANPNGNLRIYIDGNTAPALEGKMSDLLGGQSALLPKPLSGMRARGYNLYFPILYARSCKITSDANGFYYLVNYRTYAAGTPVVSFNSAQLNTLQPAIKRAATLLGEPRAAGIWPRQVNLLNLRLAPGATAPLARASGMQAITQLLMRPAPGTSEAALRGVVLRMSFDGQNTVEVPLGDFFGTAPGRDAFTSLPLGITSDGEMWSNWVMPFQRSARVWLHNMGNSTVLLKGQIGLAPYRWTPNSMHFYAGFRSRYDIATRPMTDLNFLQSSGQGVFAGLSYAIDNPTRAWWGEGDEKIYVDGEKFPSFFGTGTEDYFGYAWSNPERFTHAYHNQPRAEAPGNYGRSSNNRFHIIDRIPFRKNLRFDMEMWHWEDVKVNLATVAYWYARRGASATFPALRRADLTVRPMPPFFLPKVAGAIEGEEMEVVAKTAQVATQSWMGTSGEGQLWWHGAPAVGDRLVLRFKVPQAGTYRVFGRFIKAKDYGIAQLAINGQNAGAPLDFYNDVVKVSDQIELGTFDLKAGANEFSATITGANPQAENGHLFGLDYLLLKPAT